MGSKNGIEYSFSFRHLLISLYSSVSSDDENDIPDFGNSKGNDNVPCINRERIDMINFKLSVQLISEKLYQLLKYTIYSLLTDFFNFEKKNLNR